MTIKTEKLILIGYRCTGKTTAARLLGERLGIPAVDSDPEIERRAGATVAEIFARHGEATFRDLEASTIADLLDRPGSLILSTGGGAVLRPETRLRLRQAGTVVWLQASPETILRRLQGDAMSATLRPNLTELPPLDEIRTLLERRHPLYAETAHTMIDTEGIAPDGIVRRLVGWAHDGIIV